ncbi:MAG: 16S rRNA (uracil(1498)-N(3))-methyltransferase [Pseudomonadales bacterium]
MWTRTSRFFIDQNLAVNQGLSLPEQTSHHIINVLRLGKGTAITLFNGQGGEYLAEITNTERRQVAVHIQDHEPVERESPLTTELGLAIIKRDAMDLAIRKCTELGVTRIVPLLTDFTTVAHKQADKRFPHWLEIIHSACEQCGRNKPPELQGITSLATWADACHSPLRLVADPGATTTLPSLESTPDAVTVLTGAEGGLSEQELELVKSKEFKPVSMGQRVLRADTAPLIMMALIQHKWGDL